MDHKLLESIVKKSNRVYLKEVSNCLNYLFSCMVEKVIYSALFKDKYKEYSNFINPEIDKIVEDIQSLNEYQKYCLMTVFGYLSYHGVDKRSITTYFSLNTMSNNDTDEYLTLLFNYNELINKLVCVINITIEEKDLIKDILNKIIRLVYCNDSEYLGSNINRLRDKIDVDNVILISNNDINIIAKNELNETYHRTAGVIIEQDKTILPIIECFETSLIGFNIKLFN